MTATKGTGFIAAVDVDYRADHALAACVVFADWADAEPAVTHTVRVSPVADYESGQFYKRELPCLLAALQQVELPLRAVVVDGFVTLSGGKKGLGAYLQDAIETPVIGVAKNPFRGADAVPLLRGDSKKPLWIGATGIETSAAVAAIAAMHGPYRFPTLLRLVDQLCRASGAPAEGQ